MLGGGVGRTRSEQAEEGRSGGNSGGVGALGGHGGIAPFYVHDDDESEQRSERWRARVRKEVERSAGALLIRNGTGARGMEVGALLVHGRHARGMRHPLGHFHEHLASDRVNMVERRFGPATGRFVPWTQNEVFCTRPALHFSLRDQGH